VKPAHAFQTLGENPRGFFVSVIFKNDSSYDSFMIVLMIVPKKKAIGESESPHFALLEKV
jgi:hypothetical protein